VCYNGNMIPLSLVAGAWVAAVVLPTGLLCGVLAEGLVSSWRATGQPSLWRRCRRCGAGGNWRAARYALSPRCPGCGHALDTRSILVGGTSALAVAITVAAQAPLSWPLVVCRATETTLLLALLFIDAETGFVPNQLTAALAAVGLLAAAVSPAGLATALIGGAGAGGFFAALVVGGRAVFGVDALGWGDASLALAIGAVVGYPLVLPALLSGIALGGLAAAVVMLRADGSQRVTFAYGPCLVAGCLFVLVGGGRLIGF